MIKSLQNIYLGPLEGIAKVPNGSLMIDSETKRIYLKELNKPQALIGNDADNSLDWGSTESDGSNAIQVDSYPFIHTYTGNSSSPTNPWYKNTFIGVGAGNYTAGDGETAPGKGDINVGIGGWTLNALTTGTQNVAIGGEALALLTTGGQNIAIGDGAMYYSVSGISNNISIGKNTLQGFTSGNYNICMGRNAGFYAGAGTTKMTSGSYHTLIGYQARPSANGTSGELVLGRNAVGEGSNVAVIGGPTVTKITAGADYTPTAGKDLVTKSYVDAAIAAALA